MTDDLVKRLRTEMWDHEYKIQKEAADRIEKLEAALREAIAIVAAHVPSGYPHLRKVLEGKDD